MPPSQLKRLKASLRDQGIIGPQQSKKQKKQNAQNGVTKEKRVHRTAALNGIREQFNPFEFKASSKKPKFEVTTENAARNVIRRPGVQKSQEEEMVFVQLSGILCNLLNLYFTAPTSIFRRSTAPA
jgi:nucleolar protein 14